MSTFAKKAAIHHRAAPVATTLLHRSGTTPVQCKLQERISCSPRMQLAAVLQQAAASRVPVLVGPAVQLKNLVNTRSGAGLQHTHVEPKVSVVQKVTACVKPSKQAQPTQLVAKAQKAAAVNWAGTVVQRVITGYAPGHKLRCNTIAMRDLTMQQRGYIQQLHDDPHTTYTVEQARALATNGKVAVSNPYAWDVTGIGSFLTTDTDIQNILNNFGQPTQPVVKIYCDLGSRVAFDVAHNNGTLTASTSTDLDYMFDAMVPLYAGINSYLNTRWEENLENYAGSKTRIPLYSVMRSEMTHDFRAELSSTTTLDEILKEVSGRPFELHHLLYKALYPDYATSSSNLMLTGRSERESEFGPGQHELMHLVASGNNKDKFGQLLPQYKAEFEKWLLKRGLSL
jgi:hypothetical protein